MYEQVSHSLLNEILNKMDKNLCEQDLRYFFTRLGANFYAIHNLFQRLYGHRSDFNDQMFKLVETLTQKYLERPSELKTKDLQREDNHSWFLHQNWVGMALYTEGFAGSLKGVTKRVNYFDELGINLIHIMPILDCPEGKNDGGYAVRNFCKIDPKIGDFDDLDQLVKQLQKRDILLTLDVVVNHTSDTHRWARKAISGDKTYQDYYYIFPDRDIPDMFEATMPEIFPETAPGNFTWNEEMQQWVMTVFNDYQWDLNYSNPSVFIEMVDIILFWANKGADILRLDAVAFLWKKIGRTCQNEREAHLILQLLKDCCQVTAPGVLFIAEAIVAPVEIIKYFGEDAINARECEIAYNATYMALLWDAIATKNTKLLNRGIQSLPDKLERSTWLNYARCHDDIGLGFDDSDIRFVEYEPYAHRKFLLDYFSGKYEGSLSTGQLFGYNEKNQDARISGTMASLVGLEKAFELNNQKQIDKAIKRILLLHSFIMSFGGIPLLYYGDEVGTINDYSYQDDDAKASDNRWMHRPVLDWNKVDQRIRNSSVEQIIFDNLKQMIAVRKELSAFSDFNNREILDVSNEHMFAFIRMNLTTDERVLIIGNFDETPQHLDLNELRAKGFFQYGQVIDLFSNKSPAIFHEELVVPPLHFYWLAA
ncbi:MAG: alpha-glucosidase C-terminal domain-containing protein [Gammaproteobacteria bacterium]|nr:alpha-glucosidase C-terminal domain-containing protein [Gammaproteobacteria bacterium]